VKQATPMRPIAGSAAGHEGRLGRLVLGKLACQAGFVISFYDLSRAVIGLRSALHGRIPDRSSPLDGQPIDKTEGVSPAIYMGEAPSEPLMKAAQQVW